MKAIERYYVKVKGTIGATVAHDTLADAYAQAQRWYEEYDKQRRVYVLQVIGTIEPQATKKSRRSKNLTNATELL